MITIRHLSSLLALAIVPVGAVAQEVVWQRTGVKGLFSFELYDVDGDGYLDWMMVDENVRGFHVVSGRDGSTLRQVKPPKDWDFARLVPVGDVDGDGVPDYGDKRILNAPPWGPDVIEVRSGKDDRILWQVGRPSAQGYGFRILGSLDVSGDGRPDVLSTNPREIEVFRNDGTLLYTVPLGVSAIGKVGDLNRDGRDDFVVGIYDSQRQGSARVLSGKDGRELVRGLGANLNDRFGFGSVGGCGDVNGDGILDFFGANDGSVLPGYVRVFSGRDGKVLWTFQEPKGRLFGSVVAVGDLDLDGMADMLVGSSLEPPTRPNAAGTVFWFSLRDGREVTRIYPPGLPFNTTFFGSYDLAIGSPQPGSPFPVFLVPDPWYSPSGRLVLLRGAPKGVQSHGTACAGKLGSIPQAGFVTGGSNSVRFHLSEAPPGASGLALLGLSNTSYLGAPLPLKLDGVGWPGCSLYTSVDAVVPITIGTTGKDRGYGSVTIPFPFKPGGTTRLYAQWAVVYPGGAPGGMTGALSWTH